MKPGLIPAAANYYLSTFAPFAKSIRKRRYFWALPLALLAGFALNPPPARGQTFTILYSFTGGADGKGPSASLVRDAAGNLYGTTVFGGNSSACAQGCGTVFKLDATSKLKVLHNFTNGVDGALPQTALIRDAAGNLYGTAPTGGAFNCGFYGGCGVAFKLTPSGDFIVLHSFSGVPDGEDPLGGLVQDANGNLYGTTYLGGQSSCFCGTVYKLDVTGNETVLHSFNEGVDDGGRPLGSLVRDSAGNLFGTTLYGGVAALGTVFKLDTTGKVTLLHAFGIGRDGASPYAGLLQAGANLYGTTREGGAAGRGTVFKLDKTGKETVLHEFTGPDGQNPLASLISDATGNLYGTTLYGGGFNGTVFKLDTKGKLTVLHSFAGGADGANPFAGMIRDAQGNLYGTTESGGAFSSGTIFKITP